MPKVLASLLVLVSIINGLCLWGNYVLKERLLNEIAQVEKADKQLRVIAQAYKDQGCKQAVPAFPF